MLKCKKQGFETSLAEKLIMHIIVEAFTLKTELDLGGDCSGGNSGNSDICPVLSETFLSRSRCKNKGGGVQTRIIDFTIVLHAAGRESHVLKY